MTDQYYFTYSYGNGDYYSGYGFANSGTYFAGQTISAGTNELGLNGFYTIDFLLSNFGSSSDVGNVYTYAYQDSDTSAQSYTPFFFSKGLASGSNGLGSELDYIYSPGLGQSAFGQTFYEADGAGISGYFFRYDYGNGDYYVGFTIASDVSYQVGSSFDSPSYGGNNQTGNNGKYTITDVLRGLDDSYIAALGQVVVTSYYDADTSGQFYTPYYYSLNLVSGSNYLGSEVDYISSPGLGLSAFGQDFYEADAAGISGYFFRYDYGNGDYYVGFTIASDVSYQVGSSFDSPTYSGNNQTGNNGKYTITDVLRGLDNSYIAALGQVVVTSYYDADTSGQFYTPYYYSLNLVSGSNYLGSEVDYIQGTLTGLSGFGQDFYEADALGISGYYFRYDYGNGDYYVGFTIASDVAYQVGSSFDSPTYSGNNQTGNNGKYTITGALRDLDSSYIAALGQVVVTSYYDADTSGQVYTPYYYSLNLVSGSDYLGSEVDYISSPGLGLSGFGQDFYEADAAGISGYFFRYDYGNGDYYVGFTIASDVAYQVGSSYDSPTYSGNNQAGNNGKYTITGALRDLDSSYIAALGQVVVTSYYDSDTSGQFYTPYYYSLNLVSGSNYLGSEVDYIQGTLTGLSGFGQDFYEADAVGISGYYFRYDYGNGDYYVGFTIASDVAYQVGSSYDSPTYSGNNETGNNGKYTITGALRSLDSSYIAALGQVVVTSYYDGNTSGQLYTPYYYSLNLTSGSDYLGSEIDYISSPGTPLDPFGEDFYEGNVLTL